jgi:hypothetical protein
VPVDPERAGVLEIVLDRTGHLAGSVVDAVTRAPVEDFVVRFVSATPRAGDEQASGWSMRWAREGPRVSDPRGRWKSGPIGSKVGSVIGLLLRARESSRRCLARASLARRSRRPRRSRPLRAVERGARHAERRAGLDTRERVACIADGLHQSSSSGSGLFRGIPRSSCTFSWNAMMAWALARRFSSLRFSRSSWTSRALGLGLGAGPRFFGARPCVPCSSSCLRHATRCDEYRPSRRRIAPGALQASASLTIRALYSAVKRRRWARWRPRGPARPTGPGALRYAPGSRPGAL